MKENDRPNKAASLNVLKDVKNKRNRIRHTVKTKKII